MTGADTPRITVPLISSAEAFRSWVNAIPNNTPTLFAWKGRYIIELLKNNTGPARVYVRYSAPQDNVQHPPYVHTFVPDYPYAGLVTIERDAGIYQGDVAAWESELLQFLISVGLSNIQILQSYDVQWWNTKAAFYESPVTSLTSVLNEDNEHVLAINIGGDIIVPWFTIDDSHGHLYVGEGGGTATFFVGQEPACPIPDFTIGNNLSSAEIPTPVTEADYTFTKVSCDTSGSVVFELTPDDIPGIPVRITCTWVNENDAWYLRGILSLI